MGSSPIAAVWHLCQRTLGSTVKSGKQQFYVEKDVIHPAVLVDLVDVVPLVGGVPPADGDKYHA